MAEQQTPHELFPSNDVRENADDWLTRELWRTRDRVRAGPVSAGVPTDGFNAELSEIDGEWVIRACITSGETTLADISRLAGLLEKHAAA